MACGAVALRRVVRASAAPKRRLTMAMAQHRRKHVGQAQALGDLRDGHKAFDRVVTWALHQRGHDAERRTGAQHQRVAVRFRTSDNPYQPRILYLMANFINDVAHENQLTASVIEQECAAVDTRGRTPEVLLRDLDEAIMALDFPRATALAHAYLQSGADRNRSIPFHFV